MKICIPTKDDRGLESRAYDHFGSAPFFAMLDIDSGRLEVVRNTELHHQPHSCNHVDDLMKYGVEAVVCSGVGRRAFAALHQVGIEVLVPKHGTIADIVSAVRTGEVHTFSADEACGGGHHGRGHGPRAGRGRGNGSGHGGAAGRPSGRRRG